MPPLASSLTALARSLGLPVHRPHHALGDALTTAQVFIALATLLDGYGPQTVRTLSLAGKRAQALSVYSTGTADRGRNAPGRP